MPSAIPFVVIEAYGPPGTVPGTERIPRNKGHSPAFSVLTIALGRKLTSKQSCTRTHTQQNLPTGAHAYLRVQVYMLTLTRKNARTFECAQHHLLNQSPPTLRLVCIYTHPHTNTIHVPARPHEEVKQ